jgi:hypothetical protein
VGVGGLKCSGVEGNGVLFTVCVGEGARVDVFGNPYIVKEIKVTECYNKSNIHYGISSYCEIVSELPTSDCFIYKTNFCYPVYFKTCLIQGAHLNPKGHIEHSKFSRENVRLLHFKIQ